eukprot:1158652-Pelagomonas_calceolata.AAC.7
MTSGKELHACPSSCALALYRACELSSMRSWSSMYAFSSSMAMLQAAPPSSTSVTRSLDSARLRRNQEGGD